MNCDATSRFNDTCEALNHLDKLEILAVSAEAPVSIIDSIKNLEAELMSYADECERIMAERREDHPSLSAAERNPFLQHIEF